MVMMSVTLVAILVLFICANHGQASTAFAGL
jgi:hypothetical protein